MCIVYREWREVAGARERIGGRVGSGAGEGRTQASRESLVGYTGPAAE